uniref:Adhesion G protein-coupled receptor E2-like n=1 Tax=Canis lupus dingo TaxID=286419 RepID=A0A8C0K455_CANLU
MERQTLTGGQVMIACGVDFFPPATVFIPRGCARWCPPKSTCVNATTCRCSPGFSSLSGEIFSSPLESCDDIDECGPPPLVSCGRLADCQNTEGSYHCMCSPGYALASGATTFMNESENTCRGRNLPTSSISASMRFGITHPTFSRLRKHSGHLPGIMFFPNSKTQNPLQRVTSVILECPPCPPEPCHNSTHCLNNIGGYECRCRPGWKPVPGSPNGPNSTVCEGPETSDHIFSDTHTNQAA